MVHDLHRGDIVLIRDERWTVRRHHQRGAVAIVDVCGCDRSNRGVHARFLLPFEPVARLAAHPATQMVSRRRWQRLARQVLGTAVPGHDSLRALAAARIDLLPFQLEPALAVVGGAAARLLIADDVGLGKTVQAGLIAAETLERNGDAHVLIVCPASLRDQWSDELSNRFGLEPGRFDSTSLARCGSLPAGANPWAAQRLIVTSIDFIKRPEVLRALESLVWDLVVIDEAHGLAGRSERYAASAVLGERARTLVLLTATPHSGDEEAFRRLCTIGDIGHQFPLSVFRRRRQDVALPSSRRMQWLYVAPTPAERAMHRALSDYVRLVARQHLHSTAAARLAMVVLSRRGCSSAAALARSVERRLQLLDATGEAPLQAALPFDSGMAEDDEPLGELAAPGLGEPEDERMRLEAILALARDAQDRESKVHAIRRLLRRSTDRAIVFTEYRDTLDAIAGALQEFNCVLLHGALAASDRREVLRQFASGAARVLLATDAASEGLNLHERCRLVVNLELPWSPTRLEQRVGRVDRIGQTRRVHQILLVAAGTSEQSVVASHLRRRRTQAGLTLAAMRPHGRHRDEIAARILDGVAVSEMAGPPVLPDGVNVPDLRDRAMDEAARAGTARRLLSHTAGEVLPARPFASAIRAATRGCWVFRIAITATEDDLLCETLLGVWYLTTRRRFSTAGEAVSHLDLARRIVLDTIRGQPPVVARLESALNSSAAPAIAREQAIIDTLQRRRARLAGMLIQRALYDRRLERETAAQRDVLEEVLAQCRDRLEHLTRQRGPGRVVVEPAFAVTLR